MEKEFVRVATRAEVPAGTVMAVEAEGVSIAVCNVGGRLYAVHDECTHECFPLTEGRLEGRELVCALHGARFDVGTGEVLAPPAYEAVRTYEVEIDGDDILVALD